MTAYAPLRAEREPGAGSRSAPPPSPAPFSPLLHLQRQVGNAEVQRMLAAGGGGGVVQRSPEQEQEEGPGVLATIGGGMVGEWNEDPTYGMMGVDLAVSLVPVADQVSDVRDIAAHLHFMVNDGQYDRPMRWVSLAFTLIGLVPEVGSAVKSASKAMIRGAGEALSHLGDILALVRRVVPEVGDVGRLGEYVARNWDAFAAFGRRAWDDAVARAIAVARRAGVVFRETSARVLAALEEVRARSGEMLNAAFEWVRRQVESAIEQLKRLLRRGGERTAERLALDTLSGITPAERAALGELSEDAWARVLDYARSNRNPASVKGKVAEELFVHLPDFDAAVGRAAAAAQREGIPPEAVQFVRDIQGIAPTATHGGGAAELTDGALVAIVGDRVRVFTVFESKSPSNLRELAKRPEEILGQIAWDFERLTELPVIINGRTFSPDNVLVSRTGTEWLGIAPPGESLSRRALNRIREGMPGFQLFNGAVSDGVLNQVANRLVGLLEP